MAEFKKTTRICEGHYVVEHPTDPTTTVHMFKLDGNLWGYSFNNGMTEGTARTLKELRERWC